jgi:hypothetical protein
MPPKALICHDSVVLPAKKAEFKNHKNQQVTKFGRGSMRRGGAAPGRKTGVRIFVHKSRVMRRLGVDLIP